MNNLFDYQCSLDTLSYTPEQKRRLAEQAARAAAMHSRRSHRPLRRTAVIAAAAVLVLAVGTAGATGVLKTAAESFAGIFGGTARTEIIDKIGRPIGACDTDNGVTITADAIIGDQYNAAIVFSITRDDGTALLPEGTACDMLLVRGNGADLHILGGSHGGSWFVDEDPFDDTVQMVQTISSDVPLNDCTATAEFDNIYRWDEASGESVPVIEGHWKFRFAVNYEDASVTLGGGETFSQGGMTFTVDAVTLSPVACKVDYTVDSEVQWSNTSSGREDPADAREAERFLENVEILLTKADGTVMDLSNSGGSISPEDGVTVCSKSTVFSEILPLEALSSISVGGIV